MSKWLKSTTQKSWQLKSSKRILMVPGFKGEFLEISDDEYMELEKTPVVAALIKHGDILVSKTEPTEVSRNASRLIDNNAKLKLELSKLQEENARLKETTHSDLADTNDALTKELEKTKKALEKAKAEAEKAKAETEATKQEAVEELSKLQAQLDAATTPEQESK